MFSPLGCYFNVLNCILFIHMLFSRRVFWLRSHDAFKLAQLPLNSVQAYFLLVECLKEEGHWTPRSECRCGWITKRVVCLSHSSSGSTVYNVCAEEEDGESGAATRQSLENSITMNKMRQLKAKMEDMNLNKKVGIHWNESLLHFRAEKCAAGVAHYFIYFLFSGRPAFVCVFKVLFIFTEKKSQLICMCLYRNESFHLIRSFSLHVAMPMINSCIYMNSSPRNENVPIYFSPLLTCPHPHNCSWVPQRERIQHTENSTWVRKDGQGAALS